MRIGHGYDVHKLVTGRPLIIGGVDIPYEKGLLGHSDADVLIHAVIDAVLGAAALGDIGSHFPDRDKRYEGISSMLLLGMTLDLVSDKYKIVNIDSTIVAQAPKLSTYVGDMRRNIAETMKTDINNVSVKATTEEGLGFTGSGEGIAAYAVALLKQL